MKSSRKLTGGMQKAIANMLHVNERQVRKYERICNELSEDEQEQIINNEISINEGYKIAQERKMSVLWLINSHQRNRQLIPL